MKINKTGVVGAGMLLFMNASNTFAIEGLRISVQCSNVVLSWPSTPGQNYIVQYCPTLGPSTPWVTLTSSLPADPTTNITFFVQSNIIQNPNCSGLGADSPAAIPTVNSALNMKAATTTDSSMPMARPASGEGVAVPLMLYPPGFDLSGLEIFDPATAEWVSGAGYTVNQTALSADQPEIPQPTDSGSGDGGTNSTVGSDPGFYLVVQDGLKILDSSMSRLTNGVLSNSVKIVFEAGNAANDGTGTNVLGNLDCAVLIVDGATFPGDGVLGPLSESFPWQFNMDTGYLENGTHTLQVVVTWLNPDNSVGNNVNITRSSDPVTITVSNRIYYPNWEPEIGEMGISAYFAETTCTNTGWTINIYDVGSNLVQTLTGYTTDGTIEAYWNMVDKNGVTRTNADIDPSFSSIITVSDPASKPTPLKKQRKSNWPDHGVWTIAYQDFFKFEYSANNLMLETIYDYADTVAGYGGYYLYYPQPGQTNDIGQTFPMRYQKTNHPDPSITTDALFLDDIMLENFLSNPNSRNFFFDGHGTAHTIGEGVGEISSTALQHTINQRYRFVMIDACSSANGDLDKAFGINGPGVFSGIYYENTGIRPAAYCGYTTDVNYNDNTPVTRNGVRYDDTIPDDVPYFVSNFLFYWDANLEGERLQDAISDARQYLSPVYNQYRENYWTIYGYDDMRIDEDNYGGSTW